MRIFSGIRPTGKIHLGNYLGAIKQWIDLQENNECVFSIVDWHAITTPYDNNDFQKNILGMASAYLSLGLSPEKCILFVQSSIKDHIELAWLLGTICPLGELKRMTQFKEKSKKQEVNSSLLNYPLLMAADILLYQTDIVPVGQDQKQHVELTRSLAKKFNRKYGKTFKEPSCQISKAGAKIMSLTQPKKKMSKTDEPNSYIEVFEEEESIRKKIMSATTDSDKKIRYDLKKKPGISNLLNIYSILSSKSVKDLEKIYKEKSYQEFKKELAELIINYLKPFKRKNEEYLQRQVYLQEILNQGAKRAQIIALSTMEQVRKNMGLV
jgi:tryptophanyl-tRNA synthetase